MSEVTVTVLWFSPLLFAMLAFIYPLGTPVFIVVGTALCLFSLTVLLNRKARLAGKPPRGSIVRSSQEDRRVSRLNRESGVQAFQ